jgi:wyosine [tRNA(Phe)-imidazoG37] synthetase (radical SAM superfamily)
VKKYVFGPVPSRRLGLSLGIDLTPSKTCTLNCRYCQLSSTSHLTAQRQEFCSPADVVAELKDVLREIEPPDWITFSGTGEPTLHSGIGQILREIKGFSAIPVCVITNGTLLSREDVRRDLMLADRVLPTLCSVVPATFQTIHQPVEGIDVPEMLAGLQQFAREFTGFLEIEVFVCPGVNDSEREISGLSRFFQTLPALGGLYLNTAVRQPLDSTLACATAADFLQLRQWLHVDVPITTVFDGTVAISQPPRKVRLVSRDEVRALLQRHPCTFAQLQVALGGDHENIQALVYELEQTGEVHRLANETWALRETVS